ncbi:DUF3365 domain-containing protein [Leptospira ellisii]|uniref:DUF3365 domain-containing protein n=1 Tax=Leptospira ellisii TaxID=2023197 RepID=A0A2N0B5Z7_9LEPT|nr:DUF3365 domain-containing protein [Leptospira ellisii]MDV6237212.1 DUF3365 domain-containing protein [Leptospira ellisii]PJZ91936.1 hypothetical protein CH379_15935 [Leptospira ellisii]PKA05947.1 hypothetical protein CH375_02320 [Leptospira ellisii]
MDSFSDRSKRNVLSSLFRLNHIAKLTSLFLVAQLLPVCFTDRNAEKKQILLELIADFQVDLQKNLESAIKTKGIVGAIEICRTVSPAKEADVKTSFPGISFRRISDKPRNPNHVPDVWEAEIFEQWKKTAKNGGAPYLVMNSNDKEVRVLQPIVLQNPTCLKCHGGPRDIDPAVSKKISELYPQDKAVGYKLGELRGAFSAIW